MIRTIHQNIIRNLLSQGRSREEIAEIPIIKNQLSQEEFNKIITECYNEVKPALPKKERKKTNNPITFRPTPKVRQKLNLIKNKSQIINQLLIKYFESKNEN